ncbi:MAG: ferritin [Candidatus Neomarinimicrobiota bacterium]
MITAKLLTALNDQIKHELESAYLYAAMVAYFKSENLDGMARWMEVQSKEEVKHATKFFDYIFERDSVAELQSLTMLAKKWAGPLDVFKAAYAHEQFITGKINDLMTLAIAEKDYASQIMLNWFVSEQVEEEDSALKVVQLLEKIGTSGQALVLADRELGKRE